MRSFVRAARSEDSNVRIFRTSKVGRFVGRRMPKWISKIDLLVLDEAHKARKSSTLLSKALERIRQKKKNCPFLFLTATPFQCDTHQELINLLHFLDKNYDPDFHLDRDAKVADNKPLHPSIVNAIKYSLEYLDKSLDKLLLEGDRSSIEKDFKELLFFIDRNFDVELDPENRSFGVEIGKRAQDGVDEYLRSLVIRNIKKKIKPEYPQILLNGIDTSLYLFGRAYLRQNARAKDGQFDDDPPPGGKFLPNSYSRLCSAHAALRTTNVSRGKQHPHRRLLNTISLKEGRTEKQFSIWSHAKIRTLIERVNELLDSNANRKNKIIIFSNHLASISKAQNTLNAHIAPILEMRKGPLLKGKKKTKKGSRIWKKAETRLKAHRLNYQNLKNMMGNNNKDLYWEDDEIEAFYDALVHGVLRYRIKDYRPLLEHWNSKFNKINDDPFLISKRRVRAFIRGFLSKPEGKPNYQRLTKRLPVRQYKIVEKFTGESTKDRRNRVLEAFNSHGVPPFVLLVSQIGGEGIDMHKACSTVIHHDLHWNPTVIEQRTGRVYRDKVKAEHVTMEVLKYPGSYDDRIEKFAQYRQAYKDFLLGEKRLGDFVRAIAENREIESYKMQKSAKSHGWVMDLSPPKIKP